MIYNWFTEFSLPFSAFEDSKNFCIAMEYVSGGELFDFVQMEEGMNESSARDMLRKIINGVQHCHENGITHRDLKLENILLDECQEPKVSADKEKCKIHSFTNYIH